jgi:hypothetical protein
MGKGLLLFIFVVLAVVVSGCALSGKPTKFVLKHPETLDFVNCDVDKWGTPLSYKSNEECVKHYESLGYFVWGQF